MRLSSSPASATQIVLWGGLAIGLALGAAGSGAGAALRLQAWRFERSTA